jgi:hypothetical protein
MAHLSKSRAIHLLFMCGLFLPQMAVQGQTTNDYRSKTPLTGSWMNASSWERYNGSAWVDAAAYPTNSANQITVRGGSTLTVSAGVMVDQLTIEIGGTVINNSTIILESSSVPDLTLNGTLDNRGTLMLNGNIFVYGTFINSNAWTGSGMWIRTGGTYKHNYTTTTGSIPACSWEEGSTLEIAGYTTATSYLSLSDNPEPRNIVWNCPDQTSTIPFPTDISRVNETFTIASTGSGSLVMGTGSSDRDLFVDGDLVQTGGTLDLSSGTGRTVLLVKGDVTLTGGALWSATRSDIYMIPDIGGSPSNLTVANACNFSGLVGLAVYTARTVNLTQDCDLDDAEFDLMGTLHCGTNIITGASFVLEPQGTLGIGHPHGIFLTAADGNIQTTSRTLGNVAGYRFECTSGDSRTGDAVPNVVWQLTSANTSGSLYLETTTAVMESLILDSPIQLLQSSLSLYPTAEIGGPSYVGADSSGEFIRMISSTGSYLFPVGTATAASPFTLDITAGSFSPGFVHAIVRGTKHASNASSSNYINRYWSLSGSGFSGLSYNASFTYTDADVAGTESAIYCGRYSGSAWTLGDQTVTATNTLGINGQSSFSDFTGGESGALPVQLAGLSAQRMENATRITWRTLSEVNNYGFYVQRRTEPSTAFVDVENGFVPGRGTTVEPHAYAFTDPATLVGVTYYRLRQMDLDGSEHAFGELRVESATAVEETAIPVTYALYQNFPNPFNPTTVVSCQLPMASKVRLVVYDMLGREVATLLDRVMESGRYELPFDGASLSSGVYVYRLTAGLYTESRKMVLMR